MTGSGESALVRKFGENALAAMATRDVPPTPQNYAVWYAYLSGTVPELKRVLDILVSNKQPITPEISAELYARFFDEGGQIKLLTAAGGRLRHIVDQLKKQLESAAGDANAFGRTLDDFSTAIGEGEAEGMRALIDDLLVETQRVAERNRQLEERLGRTADEVNELRQNLESVQREALTDALTGIPNRKSFELRLREAAREAMEHGEPLSLLIGDIDHFKHFNDTYGHQIGDQVLRLVAKTLTDSVKGRDTPARYGGEEFAIILPQTRLAEAAVVADQVRVGLSRRKLVGRDRRGEYGSVTLSFGAAQYRAGETLSTLIERADAALYRAKRQGRNRVEVEEPKPVAAA
ncbi:MAG TPA: GGDEF domain-containing protein [Stellaceae bacterium]|nr:GGDEF domain-containing protein [Stellaceae bacterium]